MINFKKRVLLLPIYMILIAIVAHFLCKKAEGGPLKAEVEITSIEKVSKVSHDNEVKNFGELSNYYDVPEGYEIGAVGEFKSGLVTCKCGYNQLVNSSRKVCVQNNYDAFGFVDLEKPDLINSCYRSKVIFFIALK